MIDKEKIKLIARAYKAGKDFDYKRASMRLLNIDAAQWITVHPGGKGPKANGKGNKKGTRCLIDSESGRILGGMGGKFNGKHISAASKKHRGAANRERLPFRNAGMTTNLTERPVEGVSGEKYEKIEKFLKEKIPEGYRRMKDPANVKRETEKAVLINNGYKDVWAPKSQVQMKDGHVYAVSEWLNKAHDFKNAVLDREDTISETDVKNYSTKANKALLELSRDGLPEGHKILSRPLEIVGETEKAVKARFLTPVDGKYIGKGEVRIIPKSQANIKKGMVVSMPEWLARKNHLDLASQKATDKLMSMKGKLDK